MTFFSSLSFTVFILFHFLRFLFPFFGSSLSFLLFYFVFPSFLFSLLTIFFNFFLPIFLFISLFLPSSFFYFFSFLSFFGLLLLIFLLSITFSHLPYLFLSIPPFLILFFVFFSPSFFLLTIFSSVHTYCFFFVITLLLIPFFYQHHPDSNNWRWFNWRVPCWQLFKPDFSYYCVVLWTWRCGKHKECRTFQERSQGRINTCLYFWKQQKKKNGKRLMILSYYVK